MYLHGAVRIRSLCCAGVGGWWCAQVLAFLSALARAWSPLLKTDSVFVAIFPLTPVRFLNGLRYPDLGTGLANSSSWVPTKVLRSEGFRNSLWGLELAMHWPRVDQQLTNSLCKILRGLFRTGIQLSGERAKSGLLNVNQGLSKGCQSWAETRSVLELPTPSLPTPFGGSGSSLISGIAIPEIQLSHFQIWIWHCEGSKAPTETETLKDSNEKVTQKWLWGSTSK